MLLLASSDPHFSSSTQASSNGIFAEEIIPIELKGQVFSVDDTIRPNVTLESLASLKPVFPEWGEASTTAGNASGVGDGAALCILTTREHAEKEGMEVLGKFVGSTVVGKRERPSFYEDIRDLRENRC